MQPITEAIPRIHALRPVVEAMDPQSGAMLESHIYSLREACSILRECSIQLSKPANASTANNHLRDRIDMLLGVVPRPNPISQTSGD